MNSIKIGALAFSLLFVGAVLGMCSRPFLPTEHIGGVQIGVGLVTTMFGLLLSLQLSAGKTYFDNQERDVTVMASTTLLLDNILDNYGPEARETREILRDNVANFITLVWQKEPTAASIWIPKDGFVFFDKIQGLSPKDDDQRSKRTLALGLAIDLRRMRWVTGSRIRSSTAISLMIVEILWGTIIFISFGLLAPFGVTAIVSLAFFALAVSSGFFLIEEMNRPFSGVIRVSSAPVREALKYLVQ
jgi:hypothetical protein